MRKFLFCMKIESGGLFVAIYCAVTNVAYAVALLLLYNFVRITKHDKDMMFVDKLKALGIGACENLIIYHTIGTVLLGIGIRKRKPNHILYFFNFHLFITIFITVFGFGYFYSIKPAFYFLVLFFIDITIRIYSLCILETIYKLFKAETKENELIKMREDTKLTYGAVDDAKSTPSHHVTFTLSSSKDSLDSSDMEESRDELRSIY
ncbi:hypothetical protein ACKWTF_014568 [Chironomus riparius]